MAYFAQLNENNEVLQVISINNKVVGEPELSFPQTEPLGQSFISNELQLSGEWKQTSYNKSFRKNYAGIYFTYDQERDAFIPPKPYTSWLLNEDTCQWEAPVPYPNDGKVYLWNEKTKQWENEDPE